MELHWMKRVNLWNKWVETDKNDRIFNEPYKTFARGVVLGVVKSTE